MKIEKLAAVCDDRVARLKAVPSSSWKPPFMNRHEPGAIGTLETYYCHSSNEKQVSLGDIEREEVAHRLAANRLTGADELATRVIISESEIESGQFSRGSSLAINVVRSDSEACWYPSKNSDVDAVYGHRCLSSNSFLFKFLNDIALELSIANSPALQPLLSTWIERQGGGRQRRLYQKKVEHHMLLGADAFDGACKEENVRLPGYIAYAVEARQAKGETNLLKTALEYWDDFASALAKECNFGEADIVSALCAWPRIGQQLSEKRIAKLISEKSQSGVNYLIRWRAERRSGKVPRLQVANPKTISDGVFQDVMSSQRGAKRKADVCKYFAA